MYICMYVIQKSVNTTPSREATQKRGAPQINNEIHGPFHYFIKTIKRVCVSTPRLIKPRFSPLIR